MKGRGHQRLALENWFSTGVTWPLPPPREHLAMSGDIFGCHILGRGLLACGRQKSGMLLNTLLCTRQCPSPHRPPERTILPHVLVALRKRNPALVLVFFMAAQGAV